ncbi:arsenate reductase [uncultured Alphaproteobacteria bacterium]|uniref:Arsenate reductase n=1 Tax=uncultured Alphaproteobacteria bacterium TaxID=91750 RepID=A0A212KHY9_9PROT|nr:arsenate reductase [uncultured Alphaproteobacteria bacterium]
MDVTIYHNPKCGTSRNVLALIRHAGIEPHVIEYLKDPPPRQVLVDLAAWMEVGPRAMLRRKEKLYAELGLDDPTLSDDALFDAMVEHPILIERPIVVTDRTAALCRPSERVLDLLPPMPPGEFHKEDGEPVLDADGKPVAKP